MGSTGRGQGAREAHEDRCVSRARFSIMGEQRILGVHGSPQRREVEIFHDGYYYSICNRRLATYLLFFSCGRCPRIKVRVVKSRKVVPRSIGVRGLDNDSTNR